MTFFTVFFGFNAVKATADLSLDILRL